MRFARPKRVLLLGECVLEFGECGLFQWPPGVERQHSCRNRTVRGPAAGAELQTWWLWWMGLCVTWESTLMQKLAEEKQKAPQLRGFFAPQGMCINETGGGV